MYAVFLCLHLSIYSFLCFQIEVPEEPKKKKATKEKPAKGKTPKKEVKAKAKK